MPVIALMLLIVVVPSCGDRPSAPAPTTEGILERVVIGHQSPPDNLDPLRHRSARAATILTQAVSLSLLIRKPEGLSPWLAAEMPRVAGRETTWILRSEARWHDGREVTSDDVVHTLGLARGLGAALGRMAAGIADVEKIEAIDARRFKVVGTKPWSAAMIERFGRSFVPLPSDFAVGQDPLTDPPGVGPYRLDRSDREETALARLEPWWGDDLEAFRDCFAARRLVERYVADQEAIVRLLGEGAIDLCGITDDQRDRDLGNDVAIRTYWLPGFSYVGWNTESSDVGDARVRRALSALVPRRRLEAEEFSGKARRRSAPFAEGEDDPTDHEAAREARRLLDEAGILDTDGDGFRDREGRRFEIDLLLPAGDIRWIDVVVSAWTDTARQTGVTITTKKFQVPQLLPELEAGRCDGFLLMQTGDDLAAALRSMLHSTEVGGGRNYSRYRSKVGDAALDALCSAGTGVEEERLRPAVDRLVLEDAPISLLFQHASHVAWRKSRLDFDVGPLGLFWPSLRR